jgi:hypothetical protein
MAKLEAAISDFTKRHGAIFTVAGLIVALLSLYFVTKTEADQKYAPKAEVTANLTEIRQDIREIRNILLEEKRGK